jgi:hypothetical protein
MGDLEAVAAADDSHGQHAGGVNDLNGAVDRIASDNFQARMIRLPLGHMIQGRVFEHLPITRDQVINAHLI